MSQRFPRQDRAKRAPRPLDPAALQELALAYVARFATSGAKLERYLVRKLRERGWEGEQEADPAAVTARLCALGYVDDAAYAAAQAGSLLRRGYGPRRIGQALSAAGIDEPTREQARPSQAAARRAALAFARKRGFGPFGPAAAVPRDRAAREKQVAAMLRAGHTLDSAREMVDAASETAAEDWVAEADDES